jgi:DNA replication ATP-dependent helicase Dna2
MHVAELIPSAASQIPAGLLYYTQLSQILRVAANKNEIRSLIAQRNDLATYLSRKRVLPGSKPATTDAEPVDNLAFLPPTIDHPRECKTCYASDSCMLYRRVRAINALIAIC